MENIKTEIAYREDGKYTEDEKREMLDLIDFNEVFVSFVMFAESGLKKYIWAEKSDDGKVILIEGSTMTLNSGSQDETQVVFSIHGNCNNILVDDFAFFGESRINDEGETEYRVDWDKWGTEKEAKEAAIQDGDYEHWKEEYIKEEF